MNGSQPAMTFGRGSSVVRIPLQLQNRSLIATGYWALARRASGAHDGAGAGGEVA